MFIAEAVLKLLGLGLKGYFYYGWNRFDFIVVAISIFDVMLDSFGKKAFAFMKAGPQLARIFRVMRISRLFKLVKGLKGL